MAEVGGWGRGLSQWGSVLAKLLGPLKDLLLISRKIYTATINSCDINYPHQWFAAVLLNFYSQIMDGKRGYHAITDNYFSLRYYRDDTSKSQVYLV